MPLRCDPRTATARWRIEHTLLSWYPRARARARWQEDDVIKVEKGEITRLKELPVPQSVGAENIQGVTNFERPPQYLRMPPAPGTAAGSSYSSVPYTYGAR